MFSIFAGLSAAQFHTYLFESRGLGGFQIGLLLMVAQFAAILSPLSQVPLIRYFKGPRLPLVFMLLGASIALVLLPYLHTFSAFIILFTLFSFCAASVFPLNAAFTFDAMRDIGHSSFFYIRTIGTMGFMVGCLISLFFPQLAQLPLLYKGFSLALFVALLLVFFGYGENSWRGKGFKSKALYSAPGFKEALSLLKNGVTLKLLLLLGWMNFANVLAIGVQGNYLIHRWNQGQGSISLAWVISTTCEIPLMIICALMLKRYGLRSVLALGIIGTVLKLVGLAFAGTLTQYYLALTMHGCFYSGALTGFSIYLDRYYDPDDRASLQTISGVFYSGIPSAMAGLSSGWIWHHHGLRAVYYVSGALSIPAAIYGFWLLQKNDLNKKPISLETALGNKT